MLREEKKKKSIKKFRKQCWKFRYLAKKYDLDRKQQRMPDLRAAVCAELPGMGPNPRCGSQVINRNEMIFIVPEEEKNPKNDQISSERIETLHRLVHLQASTLYRVSVSVSIYSKQVATT